MRFSDSLLRPALRAAWPSFTDPIFDVVVIRSEEQVIRSDARRVIALVQHMQSISDRFDKDIKCEAVSKPELPAASADTNNAIPSGISVT